MIARQAPTNLAGTDEASCRIREPLKEFHSNVVCRQKQHAGSPLRYRRPKGHGKDDTSEDDKRKFLRMLLAPKSPTSATDRLRSEVIRCIEDFGMVSDFPAQLGRRRLLDAAAEVLVQIHRQTSPHRDAVADMMPILGSYGRAITLAREFIESPSARHTSDTLVGIDLLGVTGALMQRHDASWTSSSAHWAGVHSLLQAVPVSNSHNEGVRACVHGSLQTFVIPTFSGKEASPFERKHWLSVEPPAHGDEPVKLTRLRAISHKLYVRLPRLIAMVRKVRMEYPGDHYSSAMSLAEELLRLQDEEAENWLLHRVRISSTREAADRPFVPFSFEYKSLVELDTAVCYWQTRLILLRLYQVLLEYHGSYVPYPTPSSTDSGSGDQESSTSNLKTQQTRIATNLLMSWQYAASSGPCGTLSCTLAIIAIWTALRHHEHFNHHSVSLLGAWLREKLEQSWLGWAIPATMAGMDGKATTLEGGPLSDVVVEWMKE